MSDQLSFDGDPQPRAVARRTDPETSHEAAASVDRIRESQDAVIACLAMYGPMHDVQLVRTYQQVYHEHGWPMQAQSGIRTRRSECVRMGRVEFTGERVPLPSGRRGRVHAAVQR